MDVIKYIRKKGVIGAFETVYKYKIDLCVQKMLLLFLKHKSLQNIIVIESHNDFDCNGGAFYDYLIKNNYNKKYKIVWVLKHPEDAPKCLPRNVVLVPEYKPSVRKDYYICIAKYFTYDQNCHTKLKKGQISIYFSHGSVGLKDCTGLISLPDNLDYCLTASDFFAPIDARQYLWEYPNKKQVICGFPEHDRFYDNKTGDLEKIVDYKFDKVILWMPTFRVTDLNRKDSIIEQKLGIPLISTLEEYKSIDEKLKQKNVLLIIKIHPKQNLETLMIKDTGNIKVLTGDRVKVLNVDNIALMKDVDALVSDYSSAAYDFLHMNKPIAYDFSDLESYSRGIVVDDPHEMIAGHEIKNIEDFYNFIDDVSEGKDPYKKQREQLFDKIFKYHDGNSCKRIAELLKL